MVLEGSTKVREDEGEAQPECPEPKKTGYGRQEERESSPFTCPFVKKTRCVEQNEGETQEECPEAKKMGYGRKGEWETRLSNEGCPFSSPISKKTGDSDQHERETTVDCPEAKKTGYGHQEAWETNLNHPNIESSNMGRPYACPAVLIPSMGPTGHLTAPSPRLAELLEGAEIPGDSGHPPDPPEWLDRDLFNEGRKFYRKYLFCLTFSELLSLLLVLSQTQTLKPLIHTGRSDSPTKARRRYLSTLFHLMSWFEGDVWDTSSPSHADLMSIRNTHTRLGHLFNQSGEYEKVLNASVQARGHRRGPDSILPGLKKDLRAAGVKEWMKKEGKEEKEIPVVVTHGKEEMKKEDISIFPEEEKKEEKEERKTRKNRDFATEDEKKKEEEGIKVKKNQEKKIKKTGKQETEEEMEDEARNKKNRTHTHTTEPNNNTTTNNNNNDPFPVFISQLDMSLTQYSFMGLILAHPEKLGAAGATRRELEGLIHFWRGLGWLLGIEDRYNFCAGDLETTRALCLEVERDILLPRLSDSNWDYEHMVRSLMDGMGQFLPMLSLPSMLRYLTHTLDVPTPALASSFTWENTFRYWLMRVTFGVIHYTPSCLRRLNMWFLRVIGRVKEEDKVNLAAYRKAQSALTAPIGGRRK
ncbi:uncharacterized protein LOC126989698 [Eriocheir sinensis]|uniref:uncharacterized protein LOC126989698 n=1 Tax=Eriocheir sinensis TaxID=95602 RepID=UPI0021C57409|nr:uncharacterized protein LOC126989698 [Eriocheir sinensis]XP_050704274.1 uncharacterized protein LOC126989698 [Eriocheir sinensis]